MLTKRIIPCLDVTGGRVVKGTKFLDLRDAGDAVELAAFYDRAGADELVFLDITASSDGRDTVIEMVARTADQIFIPFTIGGGIRSVADMKRMLDAGADKVAVNTAAALNPNLLAEGANHFGSQAIVLAIDARRRQSDNPKAGWEVFLHGGRTPIGLDAIEWATRGAELGAGEILLTSMDKDGTRDGYDLELTRAVSQAVGIPVIASGGVGTLDHLYDGIVSGKADAVLAASIFHFGDYSIAHAKQYLAGRKLPIRLVS